MAPTTATDLRSDNFLASKFSQHDPYGNKRVNPSQIVSLQHIPSIQKVGAHQYIQALKDLRLEDHVAVEYFVVKYHARSFSDVVEHVPLGRDATTLYFLEPGIVALNTSEEDLDVIGIKEETRIVEFKTRMEFLDRCRPLKEEVGNDPNSTLRYGLVLGSLFSQKQDKNEQPKYTVHPFMVVLNALDKSLWVVFNPWDDEFQDFESQGGWGFNPWNYLPGENRDRKEFDVMKIMGPEEIFEDSDHRGALLRPYNMRRRPEVPGKSTPAAYVHSAQISDLMFDEVMAHTGRRSYLDTYSIDASDFRAKYHQWRTE